MAKLASALYLLVHALPEEDQHDTNDARAGEVCPMLVSESTMCVVQSPRRPGVGNIAHRSWTGTSKPIERLRCTLCHREFSEREGTWMARSKRPEATVEQLLQCQRGGVCDEGTAEIWSVDLKTVYRL